MHAPTTADIAPERARTSITGGRYVGLILREAEILGEDVTCGTVAERFTVDPSPAALVIQRAGGAYGLVDRLTFLARYLERFNRDLFQRKSIAALMDHQPLVVDWATPIDRVGLLAADASGNSVRSAFVIVRDGACVGIGLGIDLMRMVAEEAQERLGELRQAQGHLVQAQTFASLGRLVAGVAHEINTPIGISLTAASHLREQVEEMLTLFNTKSLRQSDFLTFASTAEEASTIIVQNIERAAGLIRSFKDVAVDQSTTERRTFNLRELVENTVRSLMPSLRKTQVEVHIACEGELDMESYPGPLAQVITNLALNASIHGFEPGRRGDFWVHTTFNPLGGVDVICRDNGCGISEQNLKRVFEPFFTTKRSQGGTGLGLHIVHNLVTQLLGGEIACASTVGEGTTFHIHIPRVAPVRSARDDGEDQPRTSIHTNPMSL